MQTAQVHILDYNEFDTLVNEHYPRKSKFSVCASRECGNDTDYFMGHITTADYFDDDFQEWLASNDDDYCSANNLLAKLVIDGVLPEGNYLICVSW